MFEQSILLPSGSTKKGWTFAASIAAEVAAVSVVLLIPLIYTERLGIGWIQSMQITPPVAKIPVVATPVMVERRPVGHKFNLMFPSAHPRPIVDLMNDPIEVAAMPDCPGCIVGAVPASASDIVGIAGNGVAPPPPPPAKPKAQPVEAKKPAEPPSGPIRVSSSMQEAKIIRRVIPVYPSLARSARVQGTVKLQGVISTDGRIERLQVISGHPLLVQAAVDAVRQWVYRPTLLNGQPVEVEWAASRSHRAD
jgi:protein TonB